jgi:acetyl-CoA carboxylase biotin carboxylase subunit
VDTGVDAGSDVPPFYDPMIAKLVAWAPTRPQAIERLLRALGEYVVQGVTVNLEYLAAVVEHPAFRAGEYDTTFCAAHEAELVPRPSARSEELALLAAAIEAYRRDREAAAALVARGTASASQWARLGRARALRGVVR